MPPKKTKKKKVRIIRERKARIKIKGREEKHKAKEGELEESLDKEEENQFSDFVSSGKAIVPVLKAAQSQIREPTPAQPATEARRAAQQPREIYGAAGQTQEEERSYRSVVLQQETNQTTGNPALTQRGIMRQRAPIAERRLLAEDETRKKYQLEEKKSGRRKYPWEV